MGTITIKSDKPEDLDFISEMAKRMGLKAITEYENSRVQRRKKKPSIKANPAILIAESIKQGLKEVEAIKAGKLKPVSLKDLLND